MNDNIKYYSQKVLYQYIEKKLKQLSYYFQKSLEKSNFIDFESLCDKIIKQEINI